MPTAVPDLEFPIDLSSSEDEGVELANDENFCIKYTVKKNQYGHGIYAAEDIPVGTMIWRFQLGKSAFEFDEQTLPAQLDAMPAEAGVELLDHTYVMSGRIFFPVGDGGYFNHSLTPNSSVVRSDPLSSTYALRDIKKGEEICENYNSYDAKADWPQWYVKMMHAHGIFDEYF